MDRDISEIGSKLTVTLERVKEIESSTHIPKYRHPVFSYKGDTRKIKNLSNRTNFLCASDESTLSNIKLKVDEHLQNQQNIKEYQYFNSEWLIENDKLYLVKINMLVKSSDGQKNIIDIYSDISEQDKLFAFWFSDTVPFGLGNIWQQYFSHPRKNDIYETQINFTIKNGEVVKSEEIDNIKLYEKKIYVEE